MKKSVVFLVLVLSFATVFSQTSTEIIKAFKKSYELEKTGEYKKASDELKKVYSNDSYEINLRIGWLLYNSGLFDQSAAHYQKAINLKPYSEEAKFGLIYPKAAQGKWTEVINLYNKILKINPKNTIANYRLGLIYYGQKNYTKAASYFDVALDLYPFDFDVLLMSAWTNYFLGNSKKAKILFIKALMNTPGNESATEGLALVK